MKKQFFIIFLSLIFMASCIVYVPTPEEPPPPPEEEYYEEAVEEAAPELDDSYFYDYLSPHGMWVFHPSYGYVWIPQSVPYGWRPYTLGQWIWTDYGWTWSSQMVWGWIPFHYGRWGWEIDLGWFWVPGTVWGPAWVTWRSSDLYMGWAPLPPGTNFIVGVGIRRGPISIPASYWVFVEGGYFLNASVHRHIYPVGRNVTIINYTVHKTNIYVRNNRVINGGIDIDRVRRITKQQIRMHELKNAKNAERRRIGPSTIEVYRPNIRKGRTAKPKTFLNRKEAKKELSRIKLKESKKKVPAVKRERVIEPQKRKVTIKDKSQKKEIKDVERKEIREVERELDKKKKPARIKTDRREIDRERVDKVDRLKKVREREKAPIKAKPKKKDVKSTKEEEKAKKEVKGKEEVKKKKEVKGKKTEKEKKEAEEKKKEEKDKKKKKKKKIKK